MNLFLLAHGLGDYIFQTSSLVTLKKKGNSFGYLAHFLIILAFNLIVTIPFLSWRLIFSALIIALIHILIDYIRYMLIKKDNAYSLIIDQCIHIFSIYIISLFFSITLYRMAYLDVAIIYIYAVFGGALLIRHILDMVNFDSQRYSINHAGKIIGILERSIIIILSAMGEFTAIGFVIAAKSIARFKELDDKEFAEYYLVGTMLSVLIALIGGLAAGKIMML